MVPDGVQESDFPKLDNVIIIMVSTVFTGYCYRIIVFSHDYTLRIRIRISCLKRTKTLNFQFWWRSEESRYLGRFHAQYNITLFNCVGHHRLWLILLYLYKDVLLRFLESKTVSELSKE